MRRWVLATIVGVPLGLCVVCVAVVWLVVLPKSRAAVSDEMADVIATQVSARIERTPFSTGDVALALDEADLDINTHLGMGECGFETGTNGTAIYGVDTTISAAGLSIVCGRTYSAVPVVRGGRVDLTNVNGSSTLMRFFLSTEKFEEGMEDGINRALDEHGLTPTEITLRPGVMTILIESCGVQVGDCQTAKEAFHAN